QSLGGNGQRFGPGGLAQPTGSAVADHGLTHPVGSRGVPEGEPPLVTQPFLVHLGVVAREFAHHLAAPVVGSLFAAGGAVFADTRGRHQVERAGPETVPRAGERPDRADLNGVSREVAVERLATRGGRRVRVVVDPGGRRGTDLLRWATFQQLDERVTRNLVREAGTALALHTPFAVQQDLTRYGQWLRECAFHVDEPRVGAAVCHRLILKWTLTPLVTHRAVQGMVDQQQLHHTLLSLVRNLGGLLVPHHHAVGHRNRARPLGLRHRTAVLLDLHRTLSTATRWFEQRVTAEPRAPRPDPLRCADDQLTFGGDYLRVVDRELHVSLWNRRFVSLRMLCLDSHDSTPPDPASTGSCRFA